MTIDLTDKVALVTGGGSGIGRGTALVLARYGAKVAVAGRRHEPLEETVRLVEESGGEAIAVPTDVSVPDDVRAMVERTVARFGRLDLACNNAGAGALASIVDLSPEAFDATIGTNLRGTFLCLQRELAVMAAQGSGGIVNVSSVNAVRPAPTASAYCASKVGVEMLTRVAALEHAAQGIRVNTVRPGFVITPMHEMVLDRMGGPTPENIERIESRVPLHRRADPAEIGEAVAWLLSDDARYVTGETITVDGGVTYA